MALKHDCSLGTLVATKPIKRASTASMIIHLIHGSNSCVAILLVACGLNTP